jgi:hypothetical protein
LKYRLYSAHDTQIGNILAVLVPEFSFEYVPYASSVFFELYQFKSKDFSVRTLYGSEVLNFPECNSKEFCSVDEFITAMKARLMVDEEIALHKECEEGP